MDLPQDDAVVAGLATDESAAERIVAALIASGIDAPSVSVCASDDARALSLAHRLGAGAARSADDPLAGAPGLDGAAGQRARSDRGALWGALCGALIGAALGFSPYGGIVPVAPGLFALADALLFFIVGIVAGAVLGTALGPRLSTHVGYRLIDGMADGDIAVIAACARAQSAAAVAAMTESGAADIIVVD